MAKPEDGQTSLMDRARKLSPHNYGRERQAESIDPPFSARQDNHNDRIISLSVYAVHLAQSVMFEPTLMCTLCVSCTLN